MASLHAMQFTPKTNAKTAKTANPTTAPTHLGVHIMELRPFERGTNCQRLLEMLGDGAV